ncbi:MAG: hypothetical protein ACKVTZ_13575 [Bacteroidia bacterium]
MRFKTILFSITFFTGLFFQSVYAQDCKPFFQGKDDLTQVTQIYYGGELDNSGFFSDKNLIVYFIAGTDNDSLRASFFITRYTTTDNTEVKGEIKDDLKIVKGAKAYLSLSNGGNIALEATNNSALQKKKSLSTIAFTTSAYYSFTKEQLKLLAENTITGYRIDLAETVLQNKKLKSNKTAKMKSQFACAVDKFK